jgi:LPXTG-site transpeptidase (sortase) family protein
MRLLTTILVLLLIFGFVLPNPVQAGDATGNAVESLVTFFRSAASEVDGLPTTSDSNSVYGDNGSSSSNSSSSYPNGGVNSGDGTTYDGSLVLALPEPAAVPAAVEAPASEAVLPHSPPTRLHIPSIGVSSGFVGLGLDGDGALTVPNAADVVGWYRGAPTPGERGPAVATAHVDWQHEKGVFHDLGRLKAGDEVTVDRADGVGVVFRVTRVAEYLKTRFPTEEVYGGTDDAELRLITCGGRYDAATHNYENNIVVFARMVDVS